MGQGSRSGGMRRRTIVVAGLAAVSLLAVACGSSSDEGGGAGASSAPGTTSGGTGGELKGSYKIGVFGPAQIPQGIDIRDAAQLAADKLNSEGKGAGGRKIEIVFCDTENGAKPEKAVGCVTQFAQTDRVDAIAGGFSSAETLATLDTVVDAQIPLVTTGAASDDVVKGVSDTERKYIFRVGPYASKFLAVDMCVTYSGQFAKDSGFTKYGILQEDTAFSQTLTPFLAGCISAPKATLTQAGLPEALTSQLPEKGPDVVAVEKHLPDAQDFSSQFKSFEDKGAQYVIELNSRQEGAAIIKQWGTLKPKFGIGGINVESQTSKFPETVGGKQAYQLNGPAGLVREAANAETGLPVLDAFKAKYGRDMIYNGASAYDAINVIAAAVGTADSAKPDDVVAALAKTSTKGVQGQISFGPNHDVVYGAGDPSKGLVSVYFQWQEDGTRKVIYPTALANGNTYVKPPWLG